MDLVWLDFQRVFEVDLIYRKLSIGAIQVNLVCTKIPFLRIRKGH